MERQCPPVGIAPSERLDGCRNIRADDRLAFGEHPPPITGIDIKTDADNTGESATAYFGDLTARSQAEDQADVSPSEKRN